MALLQKTALPPEYSPFAAQARREGRKKATGTENGGKATADVRASRCVPAAVFSRNCRFPSGGTGKGRIFFRRFAAAAEAAHRAERRLGGQCGKRALRARASAVLCIWRAVRERRTSVAQRRAHSRMAQGRNDPCTNCRFRLDGGAGGRFSPRVWQNKRRGSKKSLSQGAAEFAIVGRTPLIAPPFATGRPALAAIPPRRERDFGRNAPASTGISERWIAQSVQGSCKS